MTTTLRGKSLPRKLLCPATAMHFYLVYDGPLSGSGNKPKPEEVRDIRDRMHSQLDLLWRTHAALKRLRQTARVAKNPHEFFGGLDSPFERDPDPEQALQDGFVNLCEPMARGGKSYLPIVRKSLDLVCSLDILFLRQEDPGELVLQGGDLDNRVKTLFDSLRVPDIDVEARYPQRQNPTCCLLESDTLISQFSVSSGRLLVPKTDRRNEVHLVIEVTVRVLKLGTWNVCLMGD